MPSGRIQQRINPTLQKEAEAILEAQGIKPSQAITIFYMEVRRFGGLPFRPSRVRRSEIPNARLRRALKEAKQGKGLQKFTNKKDFFDSLHAL